MFKTGFRDICGSYGIKVSDALIEQLKKHFDSQKDSPEKYKPASGKGRISGGHQENVRTPRTNEDPQNWFGRVFDIHDSFVRHNSGDIERSS